MNPPEIEIIIPTLNRAAMLAGAIKSALAQDYPALKVVVSDNGSTDGTPGVCETFAADQRFRYVRQRETLPMYAHWNTVLKKNVSAEWTLILSDDDELSDPAYLSKAAALITLYPRLVMVHADYDTLYEATGELRPTRRELPELAEGSWYFINYHGKADAFRLMTVLFRRNAAGDFAMFSSPGVFGCDTMDFLRLSLNGQVGFVGTSAAVYRMHSGRESERKPWLTYFENLEHIYIPYLYARDKKVFKPEELQRWLHRRFIPYFLGILETISKTGDIPACFRLFVMTWRRYPWCARFFLRPDFVLRAGVLLARAMAASFSGRN